MLDEVLRRQCQLDPSRPILVGVSGGADSLCLLGILQEAGYRVIVAHFDHRLRPSSGQDSACVAELARRRALSFISDSADVSARAAEEGMSIEEAARHLRYRFLFAAARRSGAQAVAVGHTADDQVETVLMHFLRGAGLAGLKGMETRLILPLFDPEIPLVRPLLSLWRADTEDWCRAHDLAPQMDASNADVSYFRNRLRHQLIPELERYNPRFREAVLRSAQALQGDHSLLQAQVDDAWEHAAVDAGEGWIALDAAQLSACPPALRRALFRRAGEKLRPAVRDIGFAALERAAAFVDAPRGARVDFINGLYLCAIEDRILLAAYEADLPQSDRLQLSEEVRVPIGTPLDLPGGWTLSVERCAADPDDWQHNADPWSAFLDADLAGEDLTLRPPRTGDIFHPLGMGGQTVKVREFFIKHKVPRPRRGGYPLVCAGGQIAWVPGLRMGHDCRVTAGTRWVLKLRLYKG
jgi:tRNA(Ile)-lysidine synthase